MFTLKAIEITMLTTEYVSKYQFKYGVSLFIDLILCIFFIFCNKTVSLLALILVFLLLKIVLCRISIRQERNREYRDLLTGLYNRYYLVNKYLKSTESKKATSLVVLDIDDFSQINSEKGYKYADRILYQVAEIMSNVFKDDYIFRFGGDEFVIMGCSEVGIYANKVEELKKKLASKNVKISGLHTSLTSSSSKGDLIYMVIDKMIKKKKEEKNFYKNIITI